MEPKNYAVVENGIVENIVVATPEYAEEQGWIEITQENGNPRINYLYQDGNFLPPPRDLEAEWAAVRSRRNQLLLESDSYVLPDRWALMTPEQQIAWSSYRQALRDIPDTLKDPKQAMWPIKPE